MNFIDIETGNLVLSSFAHYFDKERDGLKRNTFRERCKLPAEFRTVKTIEIHCKELSEAFFTRKLTDISCFGDIVIFSW
jgi:hypothetical protein